MRHRFQQARCRRAPWVAALAVALALLGNLAADDAVAQNHHGAHQLRFGVFGQWSITTLDVSETIAPAATVSGSTTDNSLGFGASFGLDLWQRNGWLLGIEGDWSYIGGSAGFRSSNYSTDWLATIRGRLGHVVNSDLMLYGTAGIAFAGINGEHTGVSNRDNADTLTGYIVGVGFERRWHHVVWFGEYMYAGLGEWKYSVTGTTTADYAGDADMHVLRTGVKFIIGEDHEPDRRR